MRPIVWTALSILAGVVFVVPGSGEESAPYYDADSAEAPSSAELERQAAVRRQVQLNDAMRRRAGLPPANGVFYYPLPGNLESVYAYGPQYPFEPNIFTPWPYVPGDIFGFQSIPPSRQPIGQVQTQTGPTTWESRPVYAVPPRDGPPPMSASPDEVLRNELTSGSAEEIPPPEPLPPSRGPREF